MQTKCGLPTAVHVFYWPVVTNITWYIYKWEQTLLDACALQLFHLFSPLLKGDQFHACPTAQSQNAVPRIFLTYQTYENLNALFNLQKLVLVVKKTCGNCVEK